MMRPPGMQNAFSSLLLMTLTCQASRGASARNTFVCGSMRAAMARTRFVIAGSGLRSPFAAASFDSFVYVCAAI